MTRRPHARAFTVIELLIVLGIIALAISILLPSLCRSREVANRVKCASNLRQIGQAIKLYTDENRGAYPRTRATSGDEVIPVFGTSAEAKNPFADDGPQPNDVTAAFFLLLRTQDITSEVFICPSSNAEKDDFGGGPNTAQMRSNFTSVLKNLSYSYQNPYLAQKAIPISGTKVVTPPTEEFALAADINPGTKGFNDNVLAVKLNDSAKEMKQANSNNHDEDGQNILYVDGHVAWETNPFVGVNRDNIYTTQDGKVNGSPHTPDDSILLPTDDD